MNKVEYKSALTEIDKLINLGPLPGTPEAERLSFLLQALHDYEPEWEEVKKEEAYENP